MLKHIIVPLDGSGFGEQAVPVALQLAERDGAEIELVHVYEEIAPHRVVRGARVFDADFDRELADDRRRYVESVASGLRSRTKVTVTVTVVSGGVREKLPEHMRMRAPDVVVMTTHGRGGLSRLWLGSTAMHLVRHVTVPILLIRPDQDRARDETPRPIRKVLIPLDVSPESERAIDNALEIAGEKDVEYVLVHVLVPVVYIAPDAAIGAVYPSEAELLEAAQQYLGRVSEPLVARGVKVETRIEWNSFPAHAILETAEQIDADMIAMQTETVGAIERALLGSVADKVMRAAHAPVLLQHSA